MMSSAMPDLRSAGVAVTVGDPEHTLGTSLMIVETADGEAVEVPDLVGPKVHFD